MKYRNIVAEAIAFAIASAVAVGQAARTPNRYNPSPPRILDFADFTNSLGLLYIVFYQ
ncbi:MAG: hypothetical protein F6K50_34975 [Moorea sp. SIO3I7]|uniref:hypothetical protein n=1 Tax=Moorena TaxID=1155738 RepID=UPI0013015FA6|nr:MULTISPECIES: hypothetical protein [Moorena]NEO00466.1 hypothetical protein [Moorena sp. SIO3I7]NEO45668.1 hypothetical protein [Moorena sp. SIO4A3]NEO60119.1 hypothetical protein [Moorena sp. SIO4G2]NEO16391.1 hypothetical protein [Moorena sp. SIO3E8]NEO24362.1 hypothetical protein [Moorena sp. SIO4A5]